MDDFTKKLIDDFADEKSAQLRDLMSKLSPTSLSIEGRREILRLLHTIKGTARAFGLSKVSAASHELETAFEQIGDYATTHAEERIEPLRSGLQKLIQLLIAREEVAPDDHAHESASRTGDRISALLANIPREFVATLSYHEKSTLAEGLDAGKNIFVVETFIDPADFAKRLIEVRGKLSKHGELIATIPSADDTEENTFRFLLICANSELKNKLESADGKIIYSGDGTDAHIPLAKLFQASVAAGKRLALEQNKNVAFQISAIDIGISPKRAKKLSDALIHLLQNSITHGIGKSGNVSLAAALVKKGIQIRISDDGRGIDLARVRELAREMDLIADAQKLSDHDVLQLVFKFGLSTAASVSEFSGRGIGLNAVKTLIEEMNGRIELDSQPSGGTTAEIFLPEE
jgi:two-component system chemotaxis sensor kinase CheA